MKISSDGVKPYSFLANNIKTGTKYIPTKEHQDTFELTTKEIEEKSTRNFSLNSFSSVATTSFKGGIPNLSLYFEMRKKLKKANLPQQTKDDIILLANTEEERLIANKFLSNEKLYNNKYMQKNIKNIIWSCNLPERGAVANKFLSDEKLYSNEYMQKNIKNIIWSCNLPERGAVANKFLSDEKLYSNEYLQKNIISIIRSCETPENKQAQISLMDKYISDEKLYNNEKLQKNISDIIRYYNTQEKAQAQISLMDKYISDEKLYNNENLQKNISDIILDCNTQEKAQAQIFLMDKYISDEKLYNNKNLQKDISNILKNCDTKEKAQAQISLMDKYISDEKLYNNENLPKNISDIIRYCDTKEKAQAQIYLMDKYVSDEKLYNNENLQKNISNIIWHCNTKEKAQVQIYLMDKYVSDEKLYNNENLQKNISDIIKNCDTSKQCAIADKFLSNEELYKNKNIQEIISNVIYQSNTPEKTAIAAKFLSDEKLYNNENLQKTFNSIISHCNSAERSAIVNKFLSDEKLYNDKNLPNVIESILYRCNNASQSAIVYIFLSDEKLYKNTIIQKLIPYIILYCDTCEKSNVSNKFLSNEKLYNNENLQKTIGDIIRRCNKEELAKAQVNLMNKYVSDTNLYKNENIKGNIGNIILSCDNSEKAQIKLNLMDKYISDPKLYNDSTLQKTIVDIINYCDSKEEGYLELKILDRIREGKIPSTLISEIKNYSDCTIVANFAELYKKNNINEIPICEKRNIINKLVKNNVELFKISDELKEMFPLIPKNQKEYCKILPALVKSLGIETNSLTQEQIEKFNSDIDKLAKTLKNISDDEFNNMVLTQEYSKDDFIKDTLEIIKNLPENEQQKVCNVFGFELRQNVKNGYTISGYPFTPSDNEKFADITDEATKEAVKNLRKKVIAFTQNNTVSVKNLEEKVIALTPNNTVSSTISDLKSNLNDILTAMPELHKLFDKSKFGSLESDIIKHSLKVMQKIAKNKYFDSLNDSDQKVLFLAALLQDITKNEKTSDPSHLIESSFDAFYITKKFNLTQDEQLKLYSLIRNHAWLKYVNQKDLDEATLTKRLQSVAFDFQNDNIFDMAKIFTHSELKSVSKNNKIYPPFREAFYDYSKQIDNYIHELKKTNPILPTTKLPKASEIASKITYVNEDCSTNIKGLYQKDGLVIIKYNEVEDWEALGFPKGSISKGIKENDINTGNIKFIAHGLDDENQLVNFDAFALPDSDALLSVSYMERPESKYRLFRPKGVLLDVDSKYIYGGGKTDSGSGCKKDISEFKKNYIFGGPREDDRKFISELIKKTLNLKDKDYIKFIEKNQNKSFLEIEPVETRENEAVETREKLIKQFALINSNTRNGNREYNEMYVSNPKVQGVFAYSYQDAVGKVSNFIKNQKDWLKNYAKTNDLPFFIFGD